MMLSKIGVFSRVKMTRHFSAALFEQTEQLKLHQHIQAKVFDFQTLIEYYQPQSTQKLTFIDHVTIIKKAAQILKEEIVAAQKPREGAKSISEYAYQGNQVIEYAIKDALNLVQNTKDVLKVLESLNMWMKINPKSDKLIGENELQKLEEIVLSEQKTITPDEISYSIVNLGQQGYYSSKLLDKIKQEKDCKRISLTICLSLIKTLQDFQVDESKLTKNLFQSVQDKISTANLSQIAQAVELNHQHRQTNLDDQGFELYVAQFTHLLSTQGGEIQEVCKGLEHVTGCKRFYGNLNISKFYQTVFNFFDSNFTSLSPYQVRMALENFPDGPFKQSLVNQTVKSFKSGQLDPSKFNFRNYLSVLQVVSQYSRPDYNVFYSFMLEQVSQNNYKRIDVEDICNLLSNAALYSKITPEQKDAIYFKATSKIADRLDQVSVEVLIPTIWSLCATNRSMVPIIPVLIKKLVDFERSKAIQRQEFVMLEQISWWVENQIEKGELPKEIRSYIPKKLREIMADEYEIYDVQLYPEAQKQLSQNMMRLRIPFREDYYVTDIIKADFLLIEQKTAILLTGKHNQMAHDSSLWGLFRLKKEEIERHGFKVELINEGKLDQLHHLLGK